ncbi:ubiquitin carboxyl-terminal hydrolase 8 [Phtheirospermum japonicum]|uniref:Ubiquitin carboxyl-terminal hydrolase n=1 Tax=Phtheirospermum japonicum TaxID=374723 RepID=A0A830D5H4_9LAMI|nr:ubiquitin carboxyl-terminal hydrolase 8 [Phtheirospermum japonicum]
MSRFLKRLTIDKALVHFPSLSHLYSKSSLFVFSLLRRIVFKSVRLMDSILSSNDDDAVFSSSFDYSFVPPSFSDPGDSIFLVPFRWWKEAVCGGGGFEGMNEVGGVLYNATAQMSGGGMDYDCEEEFMGGFKDSEISVGMRREEEAQVSGEESVSGGDDDLALVSEWMFFTSLKWHYDKEDGENLLPEEDSAHDLFSLKIKLLYTREASHLGIKISEKLHIWDFSGQTNHLFVGDTKSSMDSGQPDEEVRIELKIYGLPSTMNDEDWNNGIMIVEQSWIDGPSSSSSPWMNGSVDEMNLFSRVMPAVGSGSYRTGALGLTGLYNLGNTCFMNSAIQCLVHTPKLVDYFLGNFRRDLNSENPLGMKGKLAIAFGDLLRKLWSPGARSVAPSMFKSTIASFAPQFSGYNQHDSQEFLSFLLDGLHEDLNRVKRKPYIPAKDEDGRPDEEVADEYWENHLSRNDSIIVDLCQGQYRSTLVCPVCKKLSITFDPFMYLSLPLPSSTVRRMTVTVLNTDGTTLPHPVTIGVPVNGTFKDLVEALGIACSLRDDERLLIAKFLDLYGALQVFHNKIMSVLDGLGESLGLIRDVDKLVAYRLPKDMDGSRLVVFSHEHEEQSFKKFGIPLVARVSDFSRGSELRKQFLNVINPFLLAGGEFLNDDASQKSAHEDELIEDAVLEEAEISNNESENGRDFKFHLKISSYFESVSHKIEMDEPLPVSKSDRPIEVIVSWPEKMIQNYDTSMRLLPELCETGLEWTQDSISLYKCVEAFLKEEPLGPEDMWYCPNCKEHRQANKKLDLWRLPEILVIHLKRFSYTKFSKNKLETHVDFPIDEFDLSNYVIQKNNTVCSRYKLYAVSNHYGGMGGGHYTAFAKHRLDRWYKFDDSHVYSVTEEQIKTQSAYVLFYKRI